MSNSNDHINPELAAYYRRYPDAEARGKKILEKIEIRDRKPRSASGWKRNYSPSLHVSGVGGAAENTRGIAIQGKKEGGKK